MGGEHVFLSCQCKRFDDFGPTRKRVLSELQMFFGARKVECIEALRSGGPWLGFLWVSLGWALGSLSAFLASGSQSCSLWQVLVFSQKTALFRLLRTKPDAFPG